MTCNCGAEVGVKKTPHMQEGGVRAKDGELVVPIVVGTAAFHLGKKVCSLSLETPGDSEKWPAYKCSSRSFAP